MLILQILSGLLLVTSCQACHSKDGLRECDASGILQEPLRMMKWLPSEHADKCRGMQSLFTCAYANKFTGGCEDSELVGVLQARKIFHAICHPKFLDHGGCFSVGDFFEDFYWDCLIDVSDDTTCSNYKKFMKCSRDLATDRCSEKHGVFLEYLAHEYVAPEANLKDCILPDVEFLKDTTTTMTTTPKTTTTTMMTTTPKTTTTTTMTTTPTTTTTTTLTSTGARRSTPTTRRTTSSRAKTTEAPLNRTELGLGDQKASEVKQGRITDGTDSSVSWKPFLPLAVLALTLSLLSQRLTG